MQKWNRSLLQFKNEHWTNKRAPRKIYSTHLRADAVSDVACLDMTSIRALVVSENLDMSTGVGTLRSITHRSDFSLHLSSLDMHRGKKSNKSHRFMTRLRRYATAACDSAESTTSRVVIYQQHRYALFFSNTKVIWLCFRHRTMEKEELTKAAKYSVSVSFPPWPRITSVTAANTAQICEAHQAIWIKQYILVVLASLHEIQEVSTTFQLFLLMQKSDFHDYFSLTTNYLFMVYCEYIIYHRWKAYLFVSSWVGLPVPLHLPEGQVGAVRQPAEKGTRGPVWKRLTCILFHTGIFTTGCDLQRTCLQLIVQLKGINCEITLFYRGKEKKNDKKRQIEAILQLAWTRQLQCCLFISRKRYSLCCFGSLLQHTESTRNKHMT